MYKIVKHCCSLKNYPKYVLKAKYSTTPAAVQSGGHNSYKQLFNLLNFI